MGGAGSGWWNDERGAAVLALYRNGLHGSEIACRLGIAPQAVSIRLGRAGINQRQEKRRRVPPVTERQILAWARAHQARHGRYPVTTSGPVEGTSGLTWNQAPGTTRSPAKKGAGDKLPTSCVRPAGRSDPLPRSAELGRAGRGGQRQPLAVRAPVFWQSLPGTTSIVFYCGYRAKPVRLEAAYQSEAPIIPLCQAQLIAGCWHSAQL